VVSTAVQSDASFDNGICFAASFYAEFKGVSIFLADKDNWPSFCFGAFRFLRKPFLALKGETSDVASVSYSVVLDLFGSLFFPLAV